MREPVAEALANVARRGRHLDSFGGGSAGRLSMTLDDSPRPAPVAESGPGAVILVIDDEPTVRMLMVEVLEQAGYSCLEAEDGRAGLQLLRSDQRIVLLITDIGLPGGLNGRELADAARATRPALKILFATGYPGNALFGNAQLDAGMAVITKPFTMAALGEKVRRMLDAGA